jgi:hypothetical protein
MPQAPEELETQQYQELSERVASLEARLSALEGRPTSPEVVPARPAQEASDPTAVIRVQVINKRHDVQQFQQYIWFDCVFTAVELSRTTRAVKGLLEFCDLFGAPQFVIGYTLNQALQPGQSLSVKGIGFDINQFLHEHQWMVGTPLDDMAVRFRVQQVLYADGSAEQF